MRCRQITHDYNLIIHSGHFYSASSSPLRIPRSAPDTERILCWSFTPKRHWQLRVKDLSKVPIVYVAARAGFEPTTLRSKGLVLTVCTATRCSVLSKSVYANISLTTDVITS